MIERKFNKAVDVVALHNELVADGVRVGSPSSYVHGDEVTVRFLDESDEGKVATIVAQHEVPTNAPAHPYLPLLKAINDAQSEWQANADESELAAKTALLLKQLSIVLTPILTIEKQPNWRCIL